MTRIAIVGCSSKKASAACAAREMYTSPLFRAARAYAEATCDRWYILSALHGLLEPATVIEPYDQRLSPATIEAWGWGVRVGQQLDAAILWPAEREAEIVMLAGELYADAIDPTDREYYWDEPLRGMGIGERLAWLKKNTPEAA